MFRIGQSSDIHQLTEGRKLILGGVEIEHEKGLLGHSDADALTHAAERCELWRNRTLHQSNDHSHFPDTDERYRGADSLYLLSCVYEMMKEKGYRIGNADALIMIERPKMAPHIQKMRENIAACLHCDIDQISIKATRGEKLGFVGREEGVLAQCVVLLMKGEEK